MSLHPLSENELENLRKAIEKNGWQIYGYIQNYFRYSITKEKLLLFTIKFPVALPVRINIPFEVVSFRVSIAFKFWNINQNINKTIFYFMKTLRDLALRVSIEHNFPIKGKENDLLEMLNLLMPEIIKDENEKTWINRIRISLANKREKFEEFDSTHLASIVNRIRTTGLNPTFKLPWELSNGVPKLRASETLFFSNDEKYDEFFILEKGFFTYFKDFEYNKFYVRSSFDCYTPYILSNLFDGTDFKLEEVIENWIKFSRMILNSILELISSGNFVQNDYINFKPERELDSRDYELDQNNFPFSPLHYESSIAKGELYPIHNDLLNSPPINFEVIESLNMYTEAEELIKNYRFNEAAELLNNSLKIFNKNRQRKIIVSILLKLRKIASLLNQSEIALNYLQNALGVAKSGEVPIDYIIKIHYKLGKSYYNRQDLVNAMKHFNVIISFLKKEQQHSINTDDFLGMAYLYIGLINLEQNQLAQSKNNFKQAFQLGNNSIKVKLNYHLLRAKQYKIKGKISQAQKLLRSGIESVGLDFKDERYEYLFFDLILELAEFYVHHRIDSRKALFLLKKVESRLALNVKEIPGIKRAIRWNLLMCDFYDLLARDSNNSTYYYKQSQILVNQLRKIGVLD
ncbi:MAG: tetratricopeptide repeat protein [Candidatus Hodarchaeota archaeon]